MRYLPLNSADRSDMMEVIGIEDIQTLFDCIPEDLKLDGPIADLPSHMSEMQVERHLGKMATKNRVASDGPFFIGGGAYKHHIPSSVDHIIQRSEFLTTYTPYQPEIAQGTLQTLFEFQTQVARLLNMDVANASMYDGSTAAAEAALMAARATRRKKIIISGGLHPHYIQTIKTACEAAGLTVLPLPVDLDDSKDIIAALDDEIAAVMMQTPNVFGAISDPAPVVEAAHAQKALFISVFTEVISFGLIKPPGDYGADIAVGEGQSIGNGLNFGGPYVGLFACTDKLKRQMPGRLCGETVDAEGKRGFVLTLSTREQHIRREKATSNICTNSGLCALAFTAHMSLLGQQGLSQMARLCHEKALELSEVLVPIKGVEIVTDTFFNEFAYKTHKPARDVIAALNEKGVLGGISGQRLWPDDEARSDLILTCATECNTADDIIAYAQALEEVLS